MSILIATWRLWLPILVLSILVGWLFKWRADFADELVANYKANVELQTRIDIENTKQEITENFRNGTPDIIATSVVDGMLRAEGIGPTESEGSSNRLLSTERYTLHADKLDKRSPDMGNPRGFTAEQIEFLKGNTDLFNRGD